MQQHNLCNLIDRPVNWKALPDHSQLTPIHQGCRFLSPRVSNPHSEATRTIVSPGNPRIPCSTIRKLMRQPKLTEVQPNRVRHIRLVLPSDQRTEIVVPSHHPEQTRPCDNEQRKQRCERASLRT